MSKGCRYINRRGYVIVDCPGHPQGNYVLEHRLVMERHLGRYLSKTEVVHHLNGDKQDNRIENLRLFPNHKRHVKGTMNPQESGRKGGIKTRDGHITLCPSCGSPVKSQFYQEVGQAGGEATLKKYGRGHYVEMGLRGGRGNKKNDIPAIRSNGHKQIQEGVRSDLLAPGSKVIE